MKKVTLREITLSITDGKHGDCEPAENSGYYFVSCKDVNNGIIDYTNSRQISERAFYETHQRTQLEPNDILITNSGTIGRMALVKDIPETYRTTFQKSVAIIKPDTSVVLPTYLYYKLQNCVKAFINSSNGSAQKNLLLGTMRNFEIDLHESFEDQKRLSSILKAYDDLIENNQKQIKLLEETAQRLYKEWFVDLHFPNYENTPIVDGVPEGWSRKKLLDIAVFLRRGISPTYSTDGKYYVINQKCIRTSIMDFSEARKQEKNYGAEFNIQDADTVICSTGTGTLGRVGQVFGNYDNTTFDSHVTLVRSDVYPNYIYHAIKDRQPYLMNMGKGSTNQQELSKEVIGTLQILIPDKVTMIYFEKSASNIHQEILTLVKKIIGLKKSRDILLPKLMRGELEV